MGSFATRRYRSYLLRQFPQYRLLAMLGADLLAAIVVQVLELRTMQRAAHFATSAQFVAYPISGKSELFYQ